MSSNCQQPEKPENLTRRDFMRDGATAAAGLAVGLNAMGSQADAAEVTKTRSYNPNMEYRPLGKTGLWVSAVCMGGHWKRVNKMVPSAFQGDDWLGGINLNDEGFKKNRRDVVTRCIESGINYIDACTREEVLTYAEALRGRRESMFLGFSWYQKEMRDRDHRTAEALLTTLEEGMKEAKLEYVDLWRITMHEQSGLHKPGEVEEMMKALEKARQQGKCRFTGLSSHDRLHIKSMIEKYPGIVQVVVTPYTAKSKVRPTDSLFDAVKEHDVGVFGIKPFSENAIFKGDCSLESPTAEEDSRLARLAIRYILATNVITAPIPGLINTQQVDNMVRALKESRELSLAEALELEQAMDRAWANLSPRYQWLKNWEYV